MNNPFEKFLGKPTPDEAKQYEESPGSPEMNQLLMKIEGLVHASNVPVHQKEVVIRIIEELDQKELEDEASFLFKSQPYHSSLTSAAVTLICRKLRNINNESEEFGDTTRLSYLIENISTEGSKWADL